MILALQIQDPFATFQLPIEGEENLDERTAFRTVFGMNTVTATKARSTLYSLISEANTSHEVIQITSKRGNAVLISEGDWRAIQETLHFQSVPGMVESIRQAQKEGVEKGSKNLDW